MTLTIIHLAQEGARALIGAPSAGAVEGTIVNAVQWLKLMVETAGAVIIGLGIATAAYQFVRTLVPPRTESHNRIRLTLARYLALALEFQLGADILSTAVAPSWEQIGKLGAIAVIRTGLNYFLTREMKEERERSAAPHGVPADGAAPEHGPPAPTRGPEGDAGGRPAGRFE